MAEGKIKINTARLDQTRDTIEEKMARIQRDMSNISESMDALNAMWEGEAHQAFAQSVAEDLRELQSVYYGIKDLTEFEQWVSGEYTQCEREIGELIGQIRI